MSSTSQFLVHLVASGALCASAINGCTVNADGGSGGSPGSSGDSATGGSPQGGTNSSGGSNPNSGGRTSGGGGGMVGTGGNGGEPGAAGDSSSAGSDAGGADAGGADAGGADAGGADAGGADAGGAGSGMGGDAPTMGGTHTGGAGTGGSTGGSTTGGSATGGAGTGGTSGGSATGGAGTGGTTGGSTAGGSSTGGSGGSGSPPLVMEVTTASNPAVPNGRLLYNITVGNTSTRAVDGVKVLLRLPVGLQYAYAEDAEPNSSTCGNWVCTENEEATWTLGSMAPGSSQTITVNPSVLDAVGDGDSIASRVTLSATGLNDINITKTVAVYSHPSAHLALGAAFDPVTPNQIFDLDLDVGQVGATALSGTVLKAYLPTGFSVVSISDGGAQASSGEISWSLGGVAVGAAAHRTVTVKVGSSARAGELQVARAELSYDGGLLVDNTAEYPFSVIAEQHPLQVTLNAPSPAVPNGRLLYTATVSNTSARAIEGVTVLLRVPTALSLAYAGDAEPDSSTCSNWVCTADEEASWSLGTMPAGSSRTISVNPSVIATDVGDGSLIAARLNVWATGTNPIQAFKAVQVYSKPSAELSLGTAADPVVADQGFSYDLDVGQIGLAALGNAQLVADLPAGLTVGTISNSGTQPTPRHVVWDLGNVAVAGTLHRSVAVTVDHGILPGSILSARAQLTYDGGAAVDAISEHSVSAIGTPLPLTVQVVPDPVSALLGERLLYTTTITNTSARAVDGVSLLLRVPRGLQHAYATDANPDSSTCGNWVCTADEEATWALGSMAAGAVQTVTVNELVAASLTGGSLIVANQRVTATGVSTPINVKTTVPTHN